MTSRSSKSSSKSNNFQRKQRFKMRLLANWKIGTEVKPAGTIIEFRSEKAAYKELTAAPTLWESIGY